MSGIAGFVTTEPNHIPCCAEELTRCFAYSGRTLHRASFPEAGAALFSRDQASTAASGHSFGADIQGRYTVVADCELYDVRPLKEECESRGWHFQTANDAELIAACYGLFGEDACLKLDGMFAFAIWDSAEKTLFLGRDPLGKKTLYYTTLKDVFYFSTTLKSFEACPGWKGTLSSGFLKFFLTLGYIPRNRTVYRDVRELMPGCCAVLGNPARCFVEKRYWNLSFAPKSEDSFENSMEECEALLTASITRCLERAEAPLLLFSGGVDSGLIAAIAHKKLKMSIPCMTSDEGSPEQAGEEWKLARTVAEHLRINTARMSFTPDQILYHLSEAYKYYDQPTSCLPFVHFHVLSEGLSNRYDAVLSGSGADELFLGYLGKDALKLDTLDKAGVPLLQKLRKFAYPQYYARFIGYDAFRYLSTRITTNVFDKEIAQIASDMSSDMHTAHVDDVIDADIFMTLKYVNADANFRMLNLAGQVHGTAFRSPFLDMAMLRFAASLPTCFKVGAGAEQTSLKYILRKIYERYVPRDVACFPKRGMGYYMKYESLLASDTFKKRYAASSEALREAGFALASQPKQLGTLFAYWLAGEWLLMNRWSK